MKNQIKPLTSMRFLFCLMVFFSHLTFLSKSDSKTIQTISKNIFDEGYIGVSFFFILSGFVLSYNYWDKFKSKTITSKEFYVARFARIYPLHLLTFLASVPLLLKSILSKPLLYLALSLVHLSLLQSFVPVKTVYFNFNSPAWSISDEMFFYLLTPFLFGALIFLKAKHNIFTSLIVLFVIVLTGMVFLPEKYQHAIFYVHPFTRVLDFILGIFIFLAYQKFDLNNLSKPLMSWLEVSSITLFLIFFAYHNHIPQVYRFSVYYWIPTIFVLLVFSFQKGAVSRILSHNKLLYLGEISFGFYMIHILVIRYYTIIANQLGLKTYYIFNALVIFIITLLLSIISFEIFEKRFNRLIKTRFSPSKQH